MNGCTQRQTAHSKRLIVTGSRVERDFKCAKQSKSLPRLSVGANVPAHSPQREKERDSTGSD
jgi:hypothetical protein